MEDFSKGALTGLRVVDLSRVLAGPYLTQMLGDLGAEIIKVERPGVGDDTRKWGPPFLKNAAGEDTTESAYYLSANRNKKSVEIDIASEEGRTQLHKLLETADILVENFKPGGLHKYGLSYDDLKAVYPALIYVSISGFGQTGPLASEPGYDFVVQAMGGLMGITGEPDGNPMKAGVAVSDLLTGLHAGIGLLAALHHREKTGEGQHVDVALLDCTIAAMTNIAQYYLTDRTLAPRKGNAHSVIVPYQMFEAKDGHLVIAVGNDSQFQHFAKFCNHQEWAKDVRFATNSARVKNRNDLETLIQNVIETKPIDYWVEGLREINVPVGAVNNMDQVFAEEQVQARHMEITMKHTGTNQDISLVGSPLRLSKTPVTYRHAPPVSGQDTKDILD